uniref:Uncharacterized protein n=1 Tax=Pipistrellus kuhlii TaxID=59472 RepID=A0A7J7VN96_PIPKU|nr:hypothetical protein mPipKuh1_008425 [Pipistrellus kuhlii]
MSVAISHLTFTSSDPQHLRCLPGTLGICVCKLSTCGLRCLAPSTILSPSTTHWVLCEALERSWASNEMDSALPLSCCVAWVGLYISLDFCFFICEMGILMRWGICLFVCMFVCFLERQREIDPLQAMGGFEN